MTVGLDLCLHNGAVRGRRGSGTTTRRADRRRSGTTMSACLGIADATPGWNPRVASAELSCSGEARRRTGPSRTPRGAGATGEAPAPAYGVILWRAIRSRALVRIHPRYFSR